MTYKHLDNCWSLKVPVKYVVDNLLMCGIRVHTFSSPVLRALNTYL